MDTARDVMESPRTVRDDASVHEVAELLLAEGRDGVCVVDAGGRLVGVVTSIDLVFQEKRPRLPTMLVFLDSYIPLGGIERSRKEMRKISAIAVSELMTSPVVTVAPEITIDVVATKMVEQHLSLVPVVEDDRVLGVVTKPALLRAIHHLAKG